MTVNTNTPHDQESERQSKTDATRKTRQATEVQLELKSYGGRSRFRRGIRLELAELDGLSTDLSAVSAVPKTALESQAVSLSVLMKQVEHAIQSQFPISVWVRAELTALTTKGGHYYLELLDKDPDTGERLASCRGTLWKTRAAEVLARFQQETGFRLDRGVQLLIRAQPTFHPQFGFALNVTDIDPVFTLGLMARQIEDIRRRLISEQIYRLNRQLPVPFDIQRVLVVAPANAAGLGDFRREADSLAQAGACTFEYVFATFQGNDAALSIRQVLTGALRDWPVRHVAAPDLIVLIRGGGAVNDLAYLNDYELAALICKRKVPVWVGIGHERDKTLLDEVAHRSFDTPSKVIHGIVQHLRHLAQGVRQSQQAIRKQVVQQGALSQQTLFRQWQSISHRSQLLTQMQMRQVDHYQQHIRGQAPALIAREKNHLAVLQQQIGLRGQGLCQASMESIQHHWQGIQQLSRQQVNSASREAEATVREILSQSPQRTLQKGYARIVQSGQTVSRVCQLTPEATVELQFQDGSAQACVLAVTLRPKDTLHDGLMNS